MPANYFIYLYRNHISTYQYCDNHYYKYYFLFRCDFHLFPHIYQPVVKFWQPKFSPLLKNPNNIPIENNNANPIIIGTPIDFNPWIIYCNFCVCFSRIGCPGICSPSNEQRIV